jgi:hypothetical protein
MSLQPDSSAFKVANTDKPSSQEVLDFHTNADTDGSIKALHHTLGPNATQAAPGNHSHDGGASGSLSGYASITHNHDTVYWKNNVPWIALPFAGGWTDYGAASFQVCQYRLVGDEVQVRGEMKHAVTTTIGVFANFPAGYKPPNQLQFLGIGSGGGIVDMRLLATGAINVNGYGANASGASISLNTIRFSILA